MEILLPVGTVLGAFLLVFAISKWIGKRDAGVVQPPRRENESQWVQELGAVKVCIRDRLC